MSMVRSLMVSVCGRALQAFRSSLTSSVSDGVIPGLPRSSILVINVYAHSASISGRTWGCIGGGI